MLKINKGKIRKFIPKLLNVLPVFVFRTQF